MREWTNKISSYLFAYCLDLELVGLFNNNYILIYCVPYMLNRHKLGSLSAQFSNVATRLIGWQHALYDNHYDAHLLGLRIRDK